MNIVLTNLARTIGEALKNKSWKLATAESCTGGGIAYACTNIAGSSDWFDSGFVTYSNLAKERMLSVPLSILEKYGAVSQETALAMAIGALTHSIAKVGIAVTGVAGPSGGTPSTPVGTVWIAWIVDSFKEAKCYHLSGEREDIRQQTIQIALEELHRKLVSE